MPILQLALSSDTLGEKDIYDLGQNFIRPSLSSVPGSAIPSPYGGRVRQIQLDVDPQALSAHGLSAADLSNALANQNQIIPAGTIKVGQFEYNVKLNNSPELVDELNRPAGQAGRRQHRLHARRGACARWRAAPAQHGAHGRPPRRADDGAQERFASTLDIVDGVKSILPRLKQTLPQT